VTQRIICIILHLELFSGVTHPELNKNDDLRCWMGPTELSHKMSANYLIQN